MSGVGTGMGSTSAPNGADKQDVVRVSKASPASEYEQSLKIVLGTVFGVFGVLGLIIIGWLVYRFCKNRHRSADTDRNASLQRSVSIDLEQKQVPSVLLLYSYDCCAHEKVVEALAGFLIETCNCSVHLDIFEEQIIHERGLDDWLVEKLQEAEFIIVLSSVGARLQCCKKKVKFKIDPSRSLPDYFAVAVDYVAEKMRVERSKGMPLTTFCVAYMDYSSENDIPPQLEMAFRFCLMKDITSLFCHLHGVNGEPTKDRAPIEGISEDSYDCSELGQELKVAVESAKEFFRTNPGWVEDRMEPVPGKLKSRHARKSSLEPLLSSQKEPAGQMSCDDGGPVPHEIISHTLPKHAMHPHTVPPGSLQNNRQNSFPSSLSSHQTLSTPPLQQNSKSCDNVIPTSTSQYDLCNQDPPYLVNLESKDQAILQGHGQGLDVDIRQEADVNVKSRSMPTVYRNSLYSSQTIFRAEVHKAWDDGDGRLSQADSADTMSNHDSIVDDLERDLKSIINPAHINPTVMTPQEQHNDFASDKLKLFAKIPLTSNFAKVKDFVMRGSGSEVDSAPRLYGDSAPQMYGNSVPPPQMYGNSVLPPQMYGNSVPPPRMYGDGQTGREEGVNDALAALSMDPRKMGAHSPHDHIQLEELKF